MVQRVGAFAGTYVIRTPAIETWRLSHLDAEGSRPCREALPMLSDIGGGRQVPGGGRMGREVAARLCGSQKPR
jgi:hypothetical protein